MSRKSRKSRSSSFDMKDHHWTGEEPQPEMYFGFVYIITNKTNNKKYIGKKQYYMASGRSKSRKTDRQSEGWNSSHWRESNWKEYTGSSKELNKEIKDLGKENFEFEILFQCVNKGDLHYIEIKTQIELDVLTSKLEDGTKEYYNKQIAGIRFIPPDRHSEETREKIRKRLRETGHPMQGKVHPNRGKKLPQCAPKAPKARGSKHITNGTENKWIAKEEEPPEGWRKGITRRDKGRKLTEKELEARKAASNASQKASRKRLAEKSGFSTYGSLVDYVLSEYNSGSLRQKIADDVGLGWTTIDRIIKRNGGVT